MRGWHPNEPLPTPYDQAQPGDVVAGAVCLPYPPSVNHMYRRAGNRVVLSPEVRAWRDKAHWYLRLAGIVAPLEGPVAVTVIAYRPRRRGDIDNLAKAVLDALNGFAFGDDGQVVLLTMSRYDDARNPRVLVRVSSVGPEANGR
ncbi:MAG: RusA family crossover junction endodeoxyribonuclease [Chloroflexi bacterium]|nr:RusA family crossover junction endodeoxyribonuclease [Chloroflexota bacterium]